MSDNVSVAYEVLKGKGPWIGKSGFSEKDTVKECGAKWSKEEKKWKATSKDVLVKLLKSGVWLADSISPAIARCIVEIADKEKRDEEVKNKAEAEKLKKEREERTIRQQASLIHIPPDEEDVVKELFSHGITADMILGTSKWSFLGPHGDISEANRLRRGLRLKIVTPDQVISGEAARRATGEGQRGRRGVKRGAPGKDRGVANAMQIISGEKAIGDEGNCVKAKEEEREKKKAHPVTYNYTTTCTVCRCGLDSRLQFGLECTCGIWTRCGRCFFPLRTGIFCKDCSLLVT